MFKVGVEYKFVNDCAKYEFSQLFPTNREFADAIDDHGGTFKVIECDLKNSRVISVMFTDGVINEEQIIFESEYKYFTEVGNSVKLIPDDLIMNLSIHNRGQAIAAIAAIHSAYQC